DRHHDVEVVADQRAHPLQRVTYTRTGLYRLGGYVQGGVDGLDAHAWTRRGKRVPVGDSLVSISSTARVGGNPAPAVRTQTHAIRARVRQAPGAGLVQARVFVVVGDETVGAGAHCGHAPILPMVRYE